MANGIELGRGDNSLQARVAQLVERQVSNLNVEGSIPFSCF